MKLYELMLLNDDWNGNTTLNINIDAITISVDCVDLAEGGLVYCGKCITCFEVESFNCYDVYLKGVKKIMKEFKIVNGTRFEVMKQIEIERRATRHTLIYCYDRPSEIKQEIFECWENFVRNNFKEFWNFGIESYNGFMFTLGWTTPEGEYYVTKTRQEFYPYK